MLNTVHLHTQIEQFQDSFSHIDIRWNGSSPVVVDDDYHVLESFEDTSAGGPKARRPTGQLHRFLSRG